MSNHPDEQAQIYSAIAKQTEKAFHLTNDQMLTICNNLIREMVDGSKSSLSMIPSYVSALPTGKEIGTAFALDIGGSNLRVLQVDLDGAGGITTKETIKKEIPVQIQQGAGEDLFEFIVASVEQLMKEGLLEYAYPQADDGVAHPTDFSTSNVIGFDVCQLLNEQFARKNLNIQVNALINDTVGTLLSGAYQSIGLPCYAGLILGTGSNTCYWEFAKNIPKWEANGAEHVIINMEAGNFGSRPDRRGVDLPLTEFDEQLDKQSINVGQQLLEKQISGMYLGELCRLVLAKEMALGNIFTKFPKCFSTPYSFETSELSTLEADESPELEHVQLILAKHGIQESTLSERAFEIGHSIGLRSASLACIQIAAILKHTKRDNEELAVAIDGSVFAKFPGYPEMMKEALHTLLGHQKVHLKLAGEGSGYGAALASFLYQK